MYGNQMRLAFSASPLEVVFWSNLSWIQEQNMGEGDEGIIAQIVMEFVSSI